MQHREYKLRVEDILEAIQYIQEYIRGLDLLTFKQDRRTIDAVVRNFEIMGEAARHIPEEIQDKYSEIPWSKIRGMRHLLAHEYFGVSSEILWTTATNDLPPLIPKLQKILSEI